MRKCLNLFTGALAGLMAVAACSASDTGSGAGGGKGTGGSSNTGGGGSSNTGGAQNTGGSSNTGGAQNTGGSTNTGGSDGTGGSGETGGTDETGGAGGTTSVDSGSGGSSAGEAGSCVQQVLTATPSTPEECAGCLCDQCLPELMAVGADGKPAADLIACAVENNCDGDCCFCKNNGHVCSTTSCGDYGNGPCAKETNLAATGNATTNCITQGKMLGMLCKTAGNACGDTTLLSQCERSKCASKCTQQAPVCLP